MKRRKPWLAFMLTQICPGLGQLYNGQLNWALFSFALSLLFAIVSTIWLFDSLQKLLWAVLAGLVLDLWLSIQAWLAARRLGEVELKKFQRWWIYILFTVVVYGLPDGYGTLFPSRIRSFQIPSESMVPNLLIGDRLVADGWSYWHSEPKRGDVIVFDYPREPSTKFVKRLIGLPGDTVEVREGEVYINGSRVPHEPSSDPVLPAYREIAREEIEVLGEVRHSIYRVMPENNENYGPQTIPPGEYFMMGDNRDRSSDSRVWGFVKRDQIIGRMAYIYFSWDQGAFDSVLEERPGDYGGAILAAIRRERFGRQIH